MKSQTQKEGKEAREFSLSQIEWIAFDLDHTIARYHIPQKEKLIYDCFLAKFVERANFSKELQNREYDIDFAFKGLILDKKKGNLFKLTSENEVCRCFHGKRRLSKEEIENEYEKDEEARKELVEFVGVATSRYLPLPTYFERPLGPLFAEIVDIFDNSHNNNNEIKENNEISHNIINNDNNNNNNNKKDYQEISKMMLEAAYSVYTDFIKGEYFEGIRKSPEKYLFDRNESLLPFLQNLRKSNKKVVMISNSLPQYAAFTCEVIFGENWQSLFDLVLLHSRKPSFWISPLTTSSSSSPFQQIQFIPKDENYSFDIISELPSDAPLQLNSIYRFGNCDQLIDSFLSSVPSSSICYVGDHLISDILIVKQKRKWKTIAIVEELEHQNLEDHLPDHAGSFLFNSQSKYWGSYFFEEDEEKNVKDTFWGKIVQLSDLSIPCLSIFNSLPIDKVFQTHPTHCLSCPTLINDVPSYTIYYEKNSCPR